MGYTTTFDGKFTFDHRPSPEVVARLRALEDAEDEPESPGGYCQWRLTDDETAIEWDGGEKFYLYDAWLQWIIDTILKPAGLMISGSVGYSGEDVRDNGLLVIDDGRVRKLQAQAVQDEFEELKRFRDYVLETDWADEILEGWKRAKGKRRR